MKSPLTDQTHPLRLILAFFLGSTLRAFQSLPHFFPITQPIIYPFGNDELGTALTGLILTIGAVFVVLIVGFPNQWRSREFWMGSAIVKKALVQRAWVLTPWICAISLTPILSSPASILPRAEKPGTEIVWLLSTIASLASSLLLVRLFDAALRPRIGLKALFAVTAILYAAGPVLAAYLDRSPFSQSFTSWLAVAGYVTAQCALYRTMDHTDRAFLALFVFGFPLLGGIQTYLVLGSTASTVVTIGACASAIALFVLEKRVSKERSEGIA